LGKLGRKEKKKLETRTRGEKKLKFREGKKTQKEKKLGQRKTPSNLLRLQKKNGGRGKEKKVTKKEERTGNDREGLENLR